MDLSRFKRACAGLSVAAIMLTQVGTAFAAYSDVPSGVWYKDAVEAFTDAGYLDATQPRFRGGDTATRAEFVKLIVMLNGGLLSTPPAVPSFNDVPTGAWFYAYMEEAAKEGWVRGDNSCYGSKPCNARPNANINRAEAASLIVRAFGLDSTGAAKQFVDNPSGQWYTEAIQTAADHCVLQGDDSTGRVRPSDNMNRAEMVVMLHRVDQGLTFGVDCGKGQVTAPAVKSVSATSATTVEVEFTVSMDKTSSEDKDNYTVSGSPALPINAAKLIAKDTVELTLGEEMVADHEYTVQVKDVETEDGDTVSSTKTFKGYAAIVKGDGELEVSLSSKNPRGDTLPKGAVGVVLLSADFTASCKDKVEVENLTVLHEGFGESTDIDGVYAAVNGARVTRKRTIDAQDQTADLRFSSALVIDPCETVTVDLVADFAAGATTAAEHNFVVELPSDVTSNANAVTGNFPLRGESFKMAAVTSGIMTITYRSVNPSQVQVGDKGVVIGKFEVDADSTEDQTLYSMTFENNSSASDGDYVNLAVRRTDGTILTNTVAQTVGDFITMVFDPPFTILEGDKITLEIVADIVNGADKSIQMHFEESSDLFAVGSLYGYGVNGQLYGSQVSIPTDNASTVSIDAGEFTIGVNGPATTQYTSDSNDAIFANVEFKTGGEDVDIKNMYILLLGQTSTGSYMCEDGFGAATAAGCSGTGDVDEIADMIEGVELRNKASGRTVSAVRMTTTGTSGNAATAIMGQYQIYRFDDFVVKGNETWQFRGDFTSNTGKHPHNGDKFRIFICGEPTHVLDSNSNLATNTTGCDFGGVFGVGGTVTASSPTYQMTVEGLSTGDKVGDVRPRGSIAGNVMEVVDASLTVEVKGLALSDTAVENAKDVNLFRFEAKASSAEDLLFTKAVFESDIGTLNDASNYALWVDTDGDRVVDTVLENGVANQSSQVTFAELAGGGYVLPKEQTVVFEVHGDVASSITGTNLRIAFDTGSTVTYVEAEKLADGTSLSGIKTNGTCASSCDVTVTTAKSTNFALRNQGDLYVSLDSQTIGARQILAGTLGEPVLRIKMHAEYEDIDVTDLVLNSSGSTAASVDSLELWLDGGTKALAVSGGCGSADTLGVNVGAAVTSTTAFCFTMDNKQLVVPKGADVKVLVRPRVKTDVQGATSANLFAFFIDSTAASNDSTGTGSVRARGVASSNNLSPNNDNDTSADGEVFIGRTSAATTNQRVVGNVNFTVLSKLASITNGGAATGTVPSGADREIGAFTFTAATNANSKEGTNQWVLSGAVFTVNATNVNMATTGFKVYNKATSMSSNNACTAYNAAGTALVGTASGVFLVNCAGFAQTTSSVNSAVDSGQSITLVLLANVTNTNTAASSGGSSIMQVSLNDFTNVTKATNGQQSGYSRIEWNDKDNTDTDTFTWVEYPDTAVNSTTYRG